MNLDFEQFGFCLHEIALLIDLKVEDYVTPVFVSMLINFFFIKLLFVWLVMGNRSIFKMILWTFFFWKSFEYQSRLMYVYSFFITSDDKKSCRLKSINKRSSNQLTVKFLLLRGCTVLVNFSWGRRFESKANNGI